MYSDPIADLLTRIRNAVKAEHKEVVVPYSKLKESLAQILVREGFVTAVEVLGTAKKLLKITLRYTSEGFPVVTGLKRVSTPGQRFYVAFSQIPRVSGGVGVTIVSTSKGLLTDKQARQQKVGGEVVCQVW